LPMSSTEPNWAPLERLAHSLVTGAGLTFAAPSPSRAFRRPVTTTSPRFPRCGFADRRQGRATEPWRTRLGR
jgi:hypothetical protein